MENEIIKSGTIQLGIEDGHLKVYKGQEFMDEIISKPTDFTTINIEIASLPGLEEETREFVVEWLKSHTSIFKTAN